MGVIGRIQDRLRDGDVPYSVRISSLMIDVVYAWSSFFFVLLVIGCGVMLIRVAIVGVSQEEAHGRSRNVIENLPIRAKYVSRGYEKVEPDGSRRIELRYGPYEPLVFNREKGEKPISTDYQDHTPFDVLVSEHSGVSVWNLAPVTLGGVAFEMCFTLFCLFLGLKILKNLKGFYDTVKNGKPFVTKNHARLMAIGFYGFTLLTLPWLVGLVRSRRFVVALNESLSGIQFSVNYDFPWTPFFFILGILTFGHVFSQAIRLKESETLTV
jgi:hypothetical protein